MKNELPPQVKKAIENGSMDRVNELLSIVSMLIYEGERMMSEVDMVLSSQGLKHGLIKQAFTRQIKATDILTSQIRSIVKDGEGKEMVNDLDKFDDQIHAMFKLQKYAEWKNRDKNQ